LIFRRSTIILSTFLNIKLFIIFLRRKISKNPNVSKKKNMLVLLLGYALMQIANDLNFEYVIHTKCGGDA
jgi:hypothetical protein